MSAHAEIPTNMRNISLLRLPFCNAHCTLKDTVSQNLSFSLRARSEYRNVDGTASLKQLPPTYRHSEDPGACATAEQESVSLPGKAGQVVHACIMLCPAHGVP
eukprot:1143328-Pelagomonas_calceolata.AAC.17